TKARAAAASRSEWSGGGGRLRQPASANATSAAWRRRNASARSATRDPELPRHPVGGLAQPLGEARARRAAERARGGRVEHAPLRAVRLRRVEADRASEAGR